MSLSAKVPFEEAFVSCPVGKLKIKGSEYDSTGSTCVVDQGQSLVSGMTNRADLKRDDGPYIVFGDHTRIVKFIDFPFVVGADGVRLYKASEKYEPEFLYLFLKSSKLPEDGYGRHSKYLKELLVPDIGKEKQRQIASLVKAQLAEVETARQAAQTQLSDARLLRARLISETFESINIAPTVLGDVILGIQAGKSFQTSEILAQPNELGVLKVSAVSWSSFQPDQAKSLNDYYEPENHHRVCKDDFIISRANTKELVGAVVLVDRDYPFRLLSDKTLRLVINEEKADKEYLLYALRAPLARNHIEHFATGTSDSMRNISQGVITSIPLILPSKPEQEIIVQKLTSQLVEIDAMEQSCKAALADIEKLPARILAQAFEN